MDTELKDRGIQVLPCIPRTIPSYSVGRGHRTPVPVAARGGEQARMLG